MEETEEFKKDENIEEFADLLEMIDAISDYKKFDRNALKNVREKKTAERGTFKDRIILDESYWMNRKPLYIDKIETELFSTPLFQYTGIVEDEK